MEFVVAKNFINGSHGRDHKEQVKFLKSIDAPLIPRHTVSAVLSDIQELILTVTHMDHDHEVKVIIPISDWEDVKKIGVEGYDWISVKKALMEGRIYARIHKELGTQCIYTFNYSLARFAGTSADEYWKEYPSYLSNFISEKTLYLNSWGFEVVSINTQMIEHTNIITFIANPKI